MVVTKKKWLTYNRIVRSGIVGGVDKISKASNGILSIDDVIDIIASDRSELIKRYGIAKM